MSRELVVRALETLDVPVSIASGLEERYSELVWQVLVRSAYAELAAGEAATRILTLGGDGRREAVRFEALMSGIRAGTPGVRAAVAQCSDTPNWMVKWMLDNSCLDNDEQLLLVESARDQGVQWYLAHEALLGKVAKKAATRRGRRFGGRGSTVWRSSDVDTTARVLSEMMYELNEAREQLEQIKRTGRVLRGKQSAELAEHGRTVLGDGSSGDSLAAWERFFLMVESECSEDLEALIDAASRVMGGVET